MQYRNRITNLFDVLKVGREAAEKGRLHMSTWVCGTAGCLVGSYDLARYAPARHYKPRLGDDFTHLALQLAGEKRMACFLFINGHLRGPGHADDAYDLTAREAIRRLEKTIAYLNRKQSMWETCQDAMRREVPAGTDYDRPYSERCNWNFAQEATQDALSNERLMP